MSNPYDAAIAVLRADLRTAITKGTSEEKQERAAIRLLEAAGKMDRQRLCAVVYDFGGFLKAANEADMKGLAGDLEAILSALPDKEKK